jgi:hypothetical protein
MKRTSHLADLKEASKTDWMNTQAELQQAARELRDGTFIVSRR